MAKPNVTQVYIIASELRARGITCADSLPLKVWLELHFLQEPKPVLIAALNEWLERMASDEAELRAEQEQADWAEGDWERVKPVR